MTLTREKLRSDAREIFRAAVEAVGAGRAVKQSLRLDGSWLRAGNTARRMDEIRRIFIIGFGKASLEMARAVEDVLEARIVDGIVSTPHGQGGKLKRITVIEAGHPVPDEAGVEAARRILALADTAGEADLILCLISGGGSALLPLPAPGITLDEKKEATRSILRSGAAIRQFNAIRKHISAIKGGGLARVSYPSHLINLVISDVVGDALDSIASGPTVPDTSTFADCVEVVRRFSLREKLPRPVVARLEDGASGRIEETPKPGDRIFSAVESEIIASNRTALAAAARRAGELGYHVRVISGTVEGEAREIGMRLAREAREVVKGTTGPLLPACLLAGGETTVTVVGAGTGGRNQELVLASAIEIEDEAGIVVLSGGTDGRDGPTEAAGAIADWETIPRARSIGLDPGAYLVNNDSYNFLKALGDLLVTGPTGTNVMDVSVLLIG